MTPRPLPRSAPAAQGVRADGIARFLDVLENERTVDPHSVMLVRHGHVVAEGWWAPYSPDRLHLLYSVSKTFTATAVGFAVAEGLLTLDDRVVDHFPEFADEIPERSRTIRIRDLLAMASGHREDMITAALQTDPSEPVRGFLLHEPEEEPGTYFTYNQLATYSIATILQRAAGTTLLEYLRQRILDPLGIGPMSWQQWPIGRDLGFSGLHGTTEAIAKLGLLHLQDGVWEGEQLLPEGWAQEVRTHRVDTPGADGIDWLQGYGYQVWISQHGYRADGAFGQLVLILPEHDVVLATTLATESVQVVLEAAWKHLLPAFVDGPIDGAEAAEAEAGLTDRLGSLALAPTDGDPQPTDPAGWSGEYLGAGEADVMAATLEASVDGWTVRLRDARFALPLPAGTGAWRITEQDDLPPMAVSGGWRDGVLHVDVLFLEGPHRLFLELQAEGRRLTTRWGTVPLGSVPPGDSMLLQRAPRPLG